MTPFNIAAINGTLYVAYENPNNESVGGVVDKFDTNGNFLGRFSSDSHLVAPWAVVQAPASFGSFGNDLLVGNFGDGHINAFNPTNGSFVGQLTGPKRPTDIHRTVVAVDIWQWSRGRNGIHAVLLLWTQRGEGWPIRFAAAFDGQRALL